jgi:hypothetical protein
MEARWKAEEALRVAQASQDPRRPALIEAARRDLDVAIAALRKSAKKPVKK